MPLGLTVCVSDCLCQTKGTDTLSASVVGQSTISRPLASAWLVKLIGIRSRMLLCCLTLTGRPCRSFLSRRVDPSQLLCVLTLLCVGQSTISRPPASAWLVELVVIRSRMLLCCLRLTGRRPCQSFPSRRVDANQLLCVLTQLYRDL